jgi:hypothetical protein
MKADISTLHKPDILILQRHEDQIRCIRYQTRVRFARRKAESEIPSHWNLVSCPATGKNFRNLDNQRSQTDEAIRKKEWHRGSTGRFAVAVFGHVAVCG